MGRLVLILALACSIWEPAAANGDFDYIIVGAGTCGLVVANRLSENPSVTVAVVEPGSDERDNINVTATDRFSQAFNTPIDWAYQTVKQPGASNRVLPLHQGKAWGGTSTINGEQHSEAQNAPPITDIGPVGVRHDIHTRKYRRNRLLGTTWESRLELDCPFPILQTVREIHHPHRHTVGSWCNL